MRAQNRFGTEKFYQWVVAGLAAALARLPLVVLPYDMRDLRHIV